MNVELFLNVINEHSEHKAGDYFSGVPDSLLSPLCDYLLAKYAINPEHHIIAANEGNAVGLAAGYHLATGLIPIVYMQNSGEGNVVNPVASLLNDHVYGIPCIFIVGWRGEPGKKDEPQHVYQGMITEKLLDMLDIESFVISEDTSEEELIEKMKHFNEKLSSGKQVAFIIRKGALQYTGEKAQKSGAGDLIREEVIKLITKYSTDDPIISTTGKASRELFEIRTNADEDHNRDFLTVGSMGHCSSIGLSIAVFKPDTTVWIIDGDGAVLMHLGSLPVIANSKPKNIIHIAINNGSHETVGGQPTVLGNIDLSNLAKDCGYPITFTVSDLSSLDEALKSAKSSSENKKGPIFIEVKCALGSRSDLGRPTTSAKENKEHFMDFLKNK